MTSAVSAPAAAEPGAAYDERARAVMRQHVLVAGLFLVVALAVAIVTSLQLVLPDVGSGQAVTSFGRLLPVGSNSLILGWLAIGLIGGGYLVVARGRPLWGGPLATVALLLAAGGTAAGVVAVAIGHNQGIELLELPSWADGIVAVALLLAALTITRTAGDRDAVVDAPAVWFVVAGSWWSALAFLAAAIPGLTGFNVSIQAAFFFSAFLLGGLLVLAVGLMYHVAGELGGDPAGRGTRLSNVGFWSLVFVAGWVGPRLLAVGPGPGWLATIGAVFSIALLVPALVVLTDLGGMIRLHWADLRASAAVRLAVLGAGLFVLVVLQNLVQALRGAGTVVQFTAWTSAFEYLLLFGVLTTWLLAFVVHVLPGAAAGARWAATHWWLTVTGLGAVVAATWLGGLQQGYTWVGAVNSGAFENLGAGFVNSVAPLEAWYWLRVGGFVVLALGLLGYLSRIVMGGRTSVAPAAAARPVAPDEAEADDEAPEAITATPIPMRVLVQGSVGLFVLVLLSIFVVPITEQAHTTASILAESRDFAAGSSADRGRDLYISEGCWYCHTQVVRPVVTDVGLGPVSVVGDYANSTPPLLGRERIGPDLTHAGSRSPTSEPFWVRNHLVSPRWEYQTQPSRPWSLMPSYDYLSAAELDDLAEYIAALK